jgi:hypothetical protein
MRPDVTFFGEAIKPLVKRALERDREQADFFLVMGTSLQVQPMSHVVGFLPPHVPQVLVNLNPVTPIAALSAGFDLSLLGPCDDFASLLAQRLGWQDFPCAKLATRVAERTFAFGPNFEPGPKEAQPEADASILLSARTAVHLEAVTCDFCSASISAGFSCSSCFDFDLCRRCYSRGKNAHTKETTHRFVALR